MQHGSSAWPAFVVTGALSKSSLHAIAHPTVELARNQLRRCFVEYLLTAGLLDMLMWHLSSSS